MLKKTKMEKILNNPVFRSGFFASMFLMSFINMCSSDKKSINKLQKSVDSLQVELDKRPTHAEIEKSLRIEGLKSEKRMIQATDRKMLDVQRQTEIDNEISQLEK